MKRGAIAPRTEAVTKVFCFFSSTTKRSCLVLRKKNKGFSSKRFNLSGSPFLQRSSIDTAPYTRGKIVMVMEVLALKSLFTPKLANLHCVRPCRTLTITTSGIYSGIYLQIKSAVALSFILTTSANKQPSNHRRVCYEQFN